MPARDYVHGYTQREGQRLLDQAMTLTELLHSDTAYPPASRVLEAGCGVGAQTVTLARSSPEAQIVSLDLSPSSVESARERVAATGLSNVAFHCGDIFRLPFATGSFDHAFVCFVLEHLREPVKALAHVREVIAPGGSITVIEGDHGSVYFHPEDPDARQAIACQITLQARMGGNALVGRQLHPLLCEAGFREVRVSPRMVYVDSSRPSLVEGFTKNTFTAMIEGVRDAALQAGLIEADAFDRGIEALYRTAEADGTFCYTFFKAVAVK